MLVVLTLDSPVLGEINSSSDEDFFAINAVAGVEYNFQADGSSPLTNFFGVLNLFDTDGTTLLETDDSSSVQSISWVAPATGTYFLSVGARFTSSFGTYELTASITNLSGNLEEGGDQDWFAFIASRGVDYQFETILDSLSNSTLRLYDTDGVTELAFNNNGGPGLASQINWRAPASGIYYVSVQGFSSFNEGTYQLTSTSSLPESFVSFNSVLFDNDSFDVSVFDSNASFAVFATIEVSSGDRETILLRDDGRFNFDGSIPLASGAHTTNDGVLQISDGDTVSVTYVDEETESGGTSTITETATIFFDDHGNDILNATPLSTVFSVLGEIETPDDVDLFSFNAIEGVEYEFIADGSFPFTNSSGTLTVFDTDGVTQLAADTSFGELDILWEAPATGQYFLRVSTDSSFSFGTYELTGTPLVPPSTIEFDAAEFAEIGPIGVNVFDPNNSGPVTVTIEASSGDSETITLDPNGSTDYSGIINSNGESINPGDGTLQVSVGDTLTVTYSDLNDGLGGTSTATNTATIFVDDHGNTASDATPLDLRLGATGELQGSFDQDLFSFTAVEGVEYEFETILGTLNDSVLRLFDTDGTTELASNDDGGVGLASLLNWQAPSSGVYFLSVESFAASDVGTYQLTATTRGTIVGRHLFYDGSSFDGDAGVHSANDDAAIDTSKAPLLTGAATFENYSNFENGITGIFIDIEGLRATPTVEDFEFRIGNSNNPSTWDLLEVAPDISVRFGSGDFGSDRVSLIWPAGTIVDQWLQVSALADGPGNIVSTQDVHYWGNQRGDTGNSAFDTTVDSGDVSNINANFSGFGLVDPTSSFDLNKDGRVDSGDVSIVSSRFSGFSPTLELINPTSASAQVQTSRFESDSLSPRAVDADGSDIAKHVVASIQQATTNDVSTALANTLGAVAEALPEPTDVPPSFQFVSQPNALPLVSAQSTELEVSSVNVDVQEFGGILQPTVQSINNSDLAAEHLEYRLERVQWTIEQFQSKSELGNIQQNRLEQLEVIAEQISDLIDRQDDEQELVNSIDHNLVDDAFSSFDNIDLSGI